MRKGRLESAFVRTLIPEADEAEIEEATQRWFGFLEIINRMVQRLACEHDDSHPVEGDDRFDCIGDL